MNRFKWIGALAALAIIMVVVILLRTTVRGVVYDENGVIAGAVVRLQGSAHYVITDENGEFSLNIPFTWDPLHITASVPENFITVGIASPPTPITLRLSAYSTEDNPAYTFISAVNPDDSVSCINCHADRTQTIGSLPVEEWLADAHAQSAVNPRFLSVYNGTTLEGAVGELTAYLYDEAIGIDIPAAPSLGQSSAGVGFRLDYPDITGSCAACHVPILALDQPESADPNHAANQPPAAEGITCDFCHKVSGVRLTAEGVPSPHLPGVLSLDLLRPHPGEQIFLAQLDDTPGDDVYSPLHHQSEFCAACHSGSFWDVPIYNSFGEWLASPYSDPNTGQTCQACHMPPLGVTAFVDLPHTVDQFVPLRDPATIFSHRMPGAADVSLLQNTAELSLDAHREGDTLIVSVGVTNTGAGHHIPTDNPLRNLILLVEAADSNGQPLSLITGEIIPDYGGIGDPAEGNYAGLPGVLYAKILADFFTGETPTFAYWRQTRLVSDNRIAALETDTSSYRFRIPSGSGEITVSARLIFRRAFIDLMVIKAWDTPDILMESAAVRVS